MENLAGCEDFIARYEAELKAKIEEANRIAKQKAAEKDEARQRQAEETNALEAAAEEPTEEDTAAIAERLEGGSAKQNRRRSWVWAYFDRSKADSQFELCNLPDRNDPSKKCLVPIKRCGGPSPFRNHILYVHQSVFQEHEGGADTGLQSTFEQTTLEQPGRAHMSNEKRDELHLRAACWIVRRNRAVQIGEKDTELRDLMLEATNGAYQLPDHHIVNAKMLTMSAEGMRNLQKINADLKKQGLKPTIAGISTI